MRLSISFALIVLAMASTSHAALSYFEYFDINTCTHGLISDDLSDEAYRSNSPVQKKARGRWILESHDGCYGYCDSKPDSISCGNDSCPEFPLAGSTYKIIQDKGSLASYKCVSGCKKNSPKFIHDMGYETDETDINIEYRRMRKAFKKACKSE